MIKEVTGLPKRQADDFADKTNAEKDIPSVRLPLSRWKIVFSPPSPTSAWNA